jgi:hypothetical protein
LAGRHFSCGCSAFGDHPGTLWLRLATGLIYGDSQAQREAALTATDPLSLPWIRPGPA